MNAPAAIKASFSDYRRVKGRKVGQLVFEVPLESFQAAIAALGGEPAAVEERWVGIALLDPSVIRQDTPIKPADKSKIYAQRAGIICNEPAFWRFLAETQYGFSPDGAEAAAQELRGICGVQSRKELIPGTPAGEKFRDIETRYRNWLAGVDA